jgi:hypothetical protein
MGIAPAAVHELSRPLLPAFRVVAAFGLAFTAAERGGRAHLGKGRLECGTNPDRGERGGC